MKKQFLTLILLPTLVLTSCGKGKLITEEEATELKEKILEKTKDIKNADCTIKASGQEGKEKTDMNLTYHFMTNDLETAYLTAVGKEKNEKIDVTLCQFKSEQYEEVTYIKEYNNESKKYDEYTFVKKDNTDYSKQSSKYGLYFLVPVLFLASYADPYEIEYHDEEGKYDIATNYYSNGENNLTIEQKKTLSKRPATSSILFSSEESSLESSAAAEVEEEEEYEVESTTTVKYEALRLKEVIIKSKSNFGNKVNINTKCSLKESRINISLPNGWEKHIVEADNE